MLAKSPLPINPPDAAVLRDRDLTITAIYLSEKPIAFFYTQASRHQIAMSYEKNYGPFIRGMHHRRHLRALRCRRCASV